MGAVDMGPQESGKKGPGLRKRKGRPGIVMDMTPMVDIGFLLVIFFMTTTRFREPQAIEINLPPEIATETAKPVKESNVMTINIMGDGTILQNIANDVPAPVAFDSLDYLVSKVKLDNLNKQPAHIDGRTGIQYESGSEFLQRYKTFMDKNKDKDIPRTVLDSLNKVRDEKICRLTVLIKVSRESSYNNVVAVMDAVQQNQVARFSITEQTPEDLKAIEDAKKKAGQVKKGGK
ncbi:biopolymer transporter ExbD [candidate division TA06 bacterium]|nr:biopolymer transporter ExbD [candidate division TA06 bacterium]